MVSLVAAPAPRALNRYIIAGCVRPGDNKRDVVAFTETLPIETHGLVHFCYIWSAGVPCSYALKQLVDNGTLPGG